MRTTEEIFETLPGAEPFVPEIIEAFKATRTRKGADYKPRTRHIKTDGRAKFTNRLFLEKSPYLLQHAHNPVNWFPWGKEAFLTAQRLKRPIFLSIGYATCHWCHVMEEESFEDETIAQYLNENFVAIKVDREERPDVDAIYMNAVQTLSGHGGWPLSVWLTPDEKPFFGGTYFPARDGDRGAGIGFLSLLHQLKNLYLSDPNRVTSSANSLTQALQKNLESKNIGSLPSVYILERAAQYYKNNYDDVFGGLRGAPKFPSSLPIRFLLREYLRTKDEELLHMATLTLKRMASGGIYDQVGGGFHRYATDAQWLVPHFEKMLYDNALLIFSYLEAFIVTGDEDFKRIVKEILRYIERDMTSSQGAFFSATDADSKDPQGHSHEGYFFTWTKKEIEDALDYKISPEVIAYYNIREPGNFELGRNILYRLPEKFIAEKFELRTIINKANQILYEQRNSRPHPLRDEKILTAWNGLIISAFARAGLALLDKNYVLRAEKAADFIIKNLKKNNRLYRSYKDQEVSSVGFLEDYAFFIAGLLDLYEASGNLLWLKEAIELNEILQSDYEDEKHGGFFTSGKYNEKLIAQEKPSYDGAEPSGNSVAILNLLRLSEFTEKESYRKSAEKALKAFSHNLETYPASLSEMLLAVDFLHAQPKEIAVVTPKGQEQEKNLFIKELNQRFLPHRVLATVEEGHDLEKHAAIIPWLKDKITQDGKATLYICERGICQLPTTEPKDVERYFERK